MEKHYILKNILLNLIKDVKKQDFLVYFRKISIIDFTDTKLSLWVVSNFMKDNLEAKFYDQILKSSKQEIATLERIEFTLDKDIDNPSNVNSIDCGALFKDASRKSPKTKERNTVWETMKEKNSVNNRYTLSNFIVWPDSQLAYSACEAVSKNPWKSYNPLYIYGDVWLGKTHLLQATWNQIYSKFKGKKVVYTTADKFISEYVSAVKKRKVEALRAKFKDIDVLIVDDVQFLAKKEQTQNELYNVFNLLYDNNKQIIISGDRAPKELENLEPRLRSRFEWGITVDIGKPDYETRLAILQEKAREKEFMIPQDVAEFIATNVTENIRELEGILNQLIAEYELTNALPELSKIAAKLKKLSFTTDILWANKKQSEARIQIKSYEDIIDAVSHHFGIEKEGILWPKRKKEFMIPRQVAMYLLKTKMHYTFERIGNIFDGRNHAAVLYSCNKLESLIKKDDNLLHELNRIRDSIWL
jgi:chromosomal replication initiator protein